MDITIIGAPMDLGQSRRGVDMGPSAIRAAGLQERLMRLGHDVEDIGNIFIPERETRKATDEKALYVAEIVEACAGLASKVQDVVEDGRFPLVLGGDHSIAMGSITGVTRARGEHGVIWVDAHADFNTPDSSPSGNVHGMPLSAVCGRNKILDALPGASPRVKEERVVLIGIRDVDAKESELVNESGITAFTMRDIDERGMRRVIEDAIEIASKGVAHVHLSFDIDAVDPRWAPGSGTLVEGGVSYREAHLLMERLHDSGVVGSAEIVEVNPLLDEHNKTGKLAAGLAASLMGKTIL
jgi:arginase